ncbi:COG0730 Predicted permeases [Rhabdaerophilaceae bacterium]
MPFLSSFAQLWPETGTLAVLLFAGLLGGLVRGFTGFGFAMIFMPIASTVLAPSLALAVIFLIDCPFALVLGAMAARRADLRGVATLLAAASLMLPVGLWLLISLDPQVMRWIICGLILAALALLMSGWRYQGKPSLPLTLGVGSVSGLFSGMASLGGMPLALFWLSSQTKSPADMRTDMQAYFGLSTLVSLGFLAWSGLLSWKALMLAIVLMPIYGLALWLGTHGFHIASEATFRRIAYGIILLAAVSGLPLLDGILR